MRPKRILITLLILGILFTCGLAFIYQQFQPYGPGGILYIARGSSVTQIATQLEAEGIIRHAIVFRLWVRWKKLERNLQFGEYQFEPNRGLTDVLDKIVRGERVTYRLTIPEGYRFDQITSLLEQRGLRARQGWGDIFNSKKFLDKIDPQAVSLEGYLFPATYEYTRDSSAEEMIQQMIATFHVKLNKDLRERARQMGWSIPALVTLASIIEKETSIPSERPLISAVFHNRLKQGMLLQTDPTVIYGIKNFDGNLRKSDLQNPHPYNTYVHAGLPIGPIASPGADAMKAVLYPADSSDLFFVAKGDGSHYFSRTLSEHNQAVMQYQIRNKN